ACSPNASQPGGSTSSSTSGGTPKRGGILRKTILGNPTHFDAHQLGTYLILYLTANCYNQLLRTDPDDENKLIGDLAKSWQLSTDARTVTFSLEPNVKWHDGKPFTSKDVEYTLNRLRNPPRGIISGFQAYFTNIQTVETPDDLTVVVRLANPEPDVLWNFAI